MKGLKMQINSDDIINTLASNLASENANLQVKIAKLTAYSRQLEQELQQIKSENNIRKEIDDNEPTRTNTDN